MIHDGQEWSSRRQIYGTRPIKGRLSLLDKPTRRNGRREGATLDAHRRSWTHPLASRGRRRRAPSGQDQVDKHRVGKLAGPGTDDGHRTGHSGSSGEVARPLSDIAAQPRRLATARNDVRAAGPDLAGKASEPFRGTSYPLSTLPKDYGAKSSTGSGQMASWFSG